MALTLVEAAKLSNDILQAGVIELIVKDDEILQRLQFKDIKGNGLTYNVETTMSGADFYQVGEVWVESTSTVTSATAVTTILGGDADVDNFLKATRSDVNDLMKEQIDAKTKAIKKAFMDTFFYGYVTTETKKFDGLHYLLRSETYNTVAVGTSGVPAALSLTEDLEKAIDMVKNGKPDLIVMSKQMKRNINKYLLGQGGVTMGETQGGMLAKLFNIPIAISDYISDDESCTKDYGTGYGHDYALGTGLATDENATSIFILQFAPQACCGVQSLPITVEKEIVLETKDALRRRIKWYPSVMVQSIISCSKVTGISNAEATE